MRLIPIRFLGDIIFHTSDIPFSYTFILILASRFTRIFPRSVILHSYLQPFTLSFTIHHIHTISITTVIKSIDYLSVKNPHLCKHLVEATIIKGKGLILRCLISFNINRGAHYHKMNLDLRGRVSKYF